VDEHYEQMRARLLAAIADHERGVLDHAGLLTAIQGLSDTLDASGHAEVRRALFEAEVALEYAQDGHPVEEREQTASLKRMRRNLREALG
jgi:hypothetical protein